MFKTAINQKESRLKERNVIRNNSRDPKHCENFTNYFLKTKANNKCFIVLKCTCTGLQKGVSELDR